MNNNYNFNSGDIISIDDCKYIVIKNYGESGLIKEYRKDGTFINNIKWANKNIIVIDENKIKHSDLKKIIAEFESFF